MRVIDVFLILLTACVLAIILSCSEVTKQLSVSVTTEIVIPQDLDNGVYYFNCTGNVFGRSLSVFKGKNPHLIVTSMAGNGTGGYGVNIGYFVNTEPKQDR